MKIEKCLYDNCDNIVYSQLNTKKNGKIQTQETGFQQTFVLSILFIERKSTEAFIGSAIVLSLSAFLLAQSGFQQVVPRWDLCGKQNSEHVSNETFNGKINQSIPSGILEFFLVLWLFLVFSCLLLLE